MIRGAQLLLLAGSVLAAGCTETQTVEVRAVADPATKLGTGTELLGQARAQLALRNVGSALEAFRQLQREQPENSDVFAGIAACYSAMGRFDVARQNLEFALAYSPDNPILLTALAGTLDQLGENEQALQVRAEAARLSAPIAETKRETKQAAVTPLGVPRTGSVTVIVPEAVVVATAQPQKQAKPEPKPLLLAQPQPQPAEIAIAPVQLASTRAKVDALGARNAVVAQRALRADAVPTIAKPIALEAPVVVQTAELRLQLPDLAFLSGSLAVARPQKASTLRQATLEAPAQFALDDATDRPAPPARRVPDKQTPVVTEARRDAPSLADDMPLQNGPHLERTNLGEVALITAPRSVERRLEVRKLQVQPAQALAMTAAESTPKPSEPVQKAIAANSLRWLPLRYASAPQSVQLLNAARTDRLAATTRIALRSQGLHNIAIGNALHTRQNSLVLYSALRTPVVRRLAAQFHCRAVKVSGLRAVVVLLGRDAAARRSDTARA